MNEIDAQRAQGDKLAAVRKMAEGIAHEINNPLATLVQITGWIKDLLGEEELLASPHHAEFRRSAAKIEENVERIRKIVHGLLGHARGREPRLENVDINEALESAISLVEDPAQDRRITIRKELSSHLPVVAADQAEVQQVFVHLISNAIDASGTDGVVQVVSRREGSRILVHVTDNGPGIPEDDQNHIFEPFFTTKQRGKGTGMGLWISYAIVERLGWSISFESKAAEGCTFTIKIPAGLTA